MLPDGLALFVLSAALLIAAAAFADGTRQRRWVAALLAAGASATPWLASPESPFLRGAFAIWTTWCFGRVVDLISETRNRPFGRRLWHVFALIDTRQTSRAAPALDVRAVGKTLAYAAAAGLGLVTATAVAFRVEGLWYWLLRWAGGALFFYCLADAVDGGVRALYRAVGVVAPRQQIVPVASRSVREFWGRRWNRAVGAWLRTHCFLPLARGGHVRLGMGAAFCASAVFHAYFTWVAVGGGMALSMLTFFLLQGAIVLLELGIGVAGWHPVFAHAWTIVAVLGCSPLFIEPLLRILQYPP
jgi:membrane bound O-acyltransferase family protein